MLKLRLLKPRYVAEVPGLGLVVTFVLNYKLIQLMLIVRVVPFCVDDCPLPTRYVFTPLIESPYVSHRVNKS